MTFSAKVFSKTTVLLNIIEEDGAGEQIKPTSKSECSGEPID
jgi:hypothetical protein